MLKDVEGCSSVAQHFMDNIRGRFTGYNEYLPKVHEKNKKDWQGSKEKLVGCSDDLFGQLTTKVLALKVETVKIGKLAHRPHCLAGYRGNSTENTLE